jgi:putative PEP-CTERM system histidine kinase
MIPFLHYLSLFGALACACLGAFVLSRNPGSGANRYFAAGMGALALAEAGAFLSVLDSPRVPFLLPGKLVLAGEILLPSLWLLFGLALVRGGAARPHAPRRLGTAAVMLLSAAFFAVLVLDAPLSEALSRDRAAHWFSVFLVLALTGTLAGFEMTLRAADHARRWRIKFLLLGVGAMLAARIYVHGQHLLYPPGSGSQEYAALTSAVVLLGSGLVAFSLVRHQLLDVDVFISRYFMYNSFTVVAVGAYLLFVGLAAQAVRSLGGSFGGHAGVLFVFAAVLSLLAVLLSTQARRKLRIFIDRHFYRNRYDYHKEWLALTERLSSKLDVREIFLPVRTLFQETLWVGNVRLWLCDDREEAFSPVRACGESASGGEEDGVRWDPRLVRALKERGYPAALEDLEGAAGPEAFAGFREGMAALGVAVLVPLVAGDRLAGVLGCSRSRSGYPLDREDFDLMNTVARQAAGSFLVAELSRSLVRAKELEAFHAFSAFVLHDMKNFVSMLSLVVQNADRNLENPEFRRDALHSISRTVEKMTLMMERLAALAREPALLVEAVDLDGLAREVAAEMEGSVRSRIALELGGPPPAAADPGEIRKILVNLILNAEEATVNGEGAARAGEIRLATFARDGKAVLAVSDAGCGMTPEFVAGSLFRPFATTKSRGFGIGLYQTRRVVEAHGGVIEVDSAVGEGTMIRILLPQMPE